VGGCWFGVHGEPGIMVHGMMRIASNSMNYQQSLVKAKALHPLSQQVCSLKYNMSCMNDHFIATVFGVWQLFGNIDSISVPST
jgi:hypothetical protein